MPRRSGPCRTPSTTSTSTPPSGLDRGRDAPGRRACGATRAPDPRSRPARPGARPQQPAPPPPPTLPPPPPGPGAAPPRGADEGVLSARRAAIVSTSGLARLATRLDLGSFLLLGEG